MKTYNKVVTIAGSDSSGGAGIQADLKTFSALGCYGMSVITALTAQNTQGVGSVFSVPPDFVEDQLEAVLMDMGVDAVKIGMLYSVGVVHIVARQLKKHAAENIVLDPVMVSQSGDRLMQDDAVQALKDLLMPLATVVTPNLPEAEVILNHRVDTLQGMEEAAREMASLGAKSVLIKGGHLVEDICPDLFYIREENRMVRLEAERIVTRNDHGTGCTLSSAVAAHLARHFSLQDAVKEAKAYLTQAIQKGASYDVGQGHGPVHHFHKFW